MKNYGETLDNRSKDIKSLYEIYPVLKKIDKENNEIISTQAIFKNVYSEEYVSSAESVCAGVLFVIKGTIKIQKLIKMGKKPIFIT